MTSINSASEAWKSAASFSRTAVALLRGGGALWRWGAGCGGTLRHIAHGPRSTDGSSSLSSTAQVGASSHVAGVVLLAAVVGIEELFEPLQKLKVVLETTFDESIDGHYFINIHFLESSLQKFEVV